MGAPTISGTEKECRVPTAASLLVPVLGPVCQSRSGTPSTGVAVLLRLKGGELTVLRHGRSGTPSKGVKSAAGAHIQSQKDMDANCIQRSVKASKDMFQDH